MKNFEALSSCFLLRLLRVLRRDEFRGLVDSVAVGTQGEHCQGVCHKEREGEREEGRKREYVMDKSEGRQWRRVIGGKMVREKHRGVS